MTKQQLETIIYNVRMSAQDNYSTFVFSNMCSAIYLVGESAFGKLGNKCLWNFIFDKDSPFENIDELYDFLTDSRIQYIIDNPTSLGEMLRNNPEDKILNDLAKVIYYETILKY